ncbi:hypothetical protein JEQ12_001760 [Ovis aries]|uniref:Uncharacterized protein n=1 Tax=Ovis aries TaxID=9940 RepID=A0A836D8S7_SHEEP|nr:hypothetical protein JEQ12_001760 [Ovis aries]
MLLLGLWAFIVFPVPSSAPQPIASCSSIPADLPLHLGASQGHLVLKPEDGLSSHPNPVDIQRTVIKIVEERNTAPPTLPDSTSVYQKDNSLLVTTVTDPIKIQLRTLDDLEKNSSFSLDGVAYGYEAYNCCCQAELKQASLGMQLRHSRAEEMLERCSQHPGQTEPENGVFYL